MKPIPDDYVLARMLLLAPNCRGTAGGLGGGYHHDHDEELGFRFNDSPLPPNRPDVAIKALLDRPRLRSRAYWVETGSLVREYLMLKAGSAYSDTLRQRFIAWLQGSPAGRRQYEEGNDMQRAALVDRYLKLVR